MPYTLLTGATGLLGRYLMRDLLLQEKPLAVLVRPGRKESAEQRIDSILAYWEYLWERSLPRPVVLAGDITQPGLGVDESQRGWVKRNCDNIIHSAASLTFYEDEGEPWRSNVEGVRNTLDFCESTDIRVFNHISSSYVCGLRTGKVFEHELNVGQQFGNDYEKSKEQAEQLVRKADFLERFTVLRPSIIVGDSQSGFSNTFHGFYTPLRVLCAMAANFDNEQILSMDFMELLDLKGHEGKNFVPVDWVSKAMVALLSSDTPPNETYAFVSQNPVSARRLLSIYQEAIRKYDPNARPKVTQPNESTGAQESPQSANSLLDAYGAQFAVYRSYWRDDPEFDDQNTKSILPNLPCPELSDEQLMMLCEYAIKAKFFWVAPQREAIELARNWITSNVTSSTIWEHTQSNGTLTWRLTVSGEGGGSWNISSASNSCKIAEVPSQAASELRLNANTLHELLNRKNQT